MKAICFIGLFIALHVKFLDAGSYRGSYNMWPCCWCPQMLTSRPTPTPTPMLTPAPTPTIASATRLGSCTQDGTYCWPTYNVSEINKMIPGVFVTREYLASTGKGLPILSGSKEKLNIATGYVDLELNRGKRKRRSRAVNPVSDNSRCCQGFSFYYCPSDVDKVEEIINGQAVVWRPLQFEPNCTGTFIQVVPVKLCRHTSCNQDTGRCEAEFRSPVVLMTCEPSCPPNISQLKFHPLRVPSACLCLNTGL